MIRLVDRHRGSRAPVPSFLQRGRWRRPVSGASPSAGPERQPATGRPSTDGFTLVEIAVVLVIIGLLVGMGAGLLGPLTRRSKLTQARGQMQSAREAIIAWASARGRLPCPDTNGNGRENAPCAAPTLGGLPYADLGVSGGDGYARTLYYDVNPDLTTPASVSGLCAILTAFPSMGGVDPRVNDGTATWAVPALVVSAGMGDADADGSVLDARNAPGDRVYDSEKRPEDNAYDDIVREVGHAALYRGICRAGDAALSITFSGAGDASFGTGPGDCFDVTAAATMLVTRNDSFWSATGCAAGTVMSFYDGVWGGGCSGGGASALDCDQNHDGRIRYTLTTDTFSDI